MFAAECVDKKKRLAELPGFDQKASAIDLPCSFSHVHLPFGGRENEKTFFALRLPIFILAFSKSVFLPQGVIIVD
jgi:hypothetical protein